MKQRLSRRVSLCGTQLVKWSDPKGGRASGHAQQPVLLYDCVESTSPARLFRGRGWEMCVSRAVGQRQERPWAASQALPVRRHLVGRKRGCEGRRCMASRVQSQLFARSASQRLVLPLEAARPHGAFSRVMVPKVFGRCRLHMVVPHLVARRRIRRCPVPPGLSLRRLAMEVGFRADGTAAIISAACPKFLSGPWVGSRALMVSRLAYKCRPTWHSCTTWCESGRSDCGV